MAANFAAGDGVKPLVIGLTGPIGSGKSHVLGTLVALGAEGIDADRVAHEVTVAPGDPAFAGGPAYAGIVAEFGASILGPNDAIDRGKLSARVFGDADALARLEAIVHPAVADIIAARVAASVAPVVVIEAIKLIESGLSRRLCDLVWVTVCPEEEQIARLAAGRGMSEAETRRRLANQMPVAQMISHADCVIDTGGSLIETEDKVRRAWHALFRERKNDTNS